jgi:hypothetical protein
MCPNDRIQLIEIEISRVYVALKMKIYMRSKATEWDTKKGIEEIRLLK